MIALRRKRCAVCKKNRPKELFYCDASQPCGLRSYCKPCEVIRAFKILVAEKVIQSRKLKAYLEMDDGDLVFIYDTCQANVKVELKDMYERFDKSSMNMGRRLADLESQEFQINAMEK